MHPIAHQAKQHTIALVLNQRIIQLRLNSVELGIDGVEIIYMQLINLLIFTLLRKDIIIEVGVKQ